MLRLDARVGRGRWGAALLAVTLAGCGGKAGGGRTAAMDSTAPGGAGGTTATPDDVAGSSEIAGVGAAAGSIGIGGSITEIGGSGTGGSNNGLPNGLTQCPVHDPQPASIDVTDASGRAEEGTNGKVRVTVTKLEEHDPSEVGVPAGLKARHYVLRGPTQDWGLSATIPGLTSELIKEGDVLDFQLETSDGYIPLSRVTNQVFGLFAPEGELLLFGADTTGDPVPDLSFLGLEVSDGGTVCGLGGDICRYAVHSAHLSAPGMELDLQPGDSGAFGNLWVRVQTFQSVLRSGNCDGSGRSVIVGAKGTVTR